MLRRENIFFVFEHHHDTGRQSARYAELARKLAELECNQQLHGENIQMILAALRQLDETSSWAYPEGRRLIGFRSGKSR